MVNESNSDAELMMELERNTKKSTAQSERSQAKPVDIGNPKDLLTSNLTAYDILKMYEGEKLNSLYEIEELIVKPMNEISP